MESVTSFFIPTLLAVVYLGMLTGYVFVIIAIWRGMKAHESLANSLREIAETFKARPDS